MFGRVDPALATRMIFNPTPSGDDVKADLSDREYQVYLALVQGRSLVDIAEELHLSAKTVSTHKFRLMRKLGVTSMSELVRNAVREGLIQ